jgi:hypothetical protein
MNMKVLKWLEISGGDYSVMDTHSESSNPKEVYGLLDSDSEGVTKL